MGRRHPAEALFREGAPQVVAISRAGKKPKAVLLLSDDSTLKVSATAAAVVGLGQGTVVDDAFRLALIEAEVVADAVHKAVKMLAASPRTAGELRERLVARGFEARAVGRALEHLEAHELIDDAAIARSIAEQPATSPAMARHTMESRLVPTDVIRTVLESSKWNHGGVIGAVRYLLERLPSALSPDAKRRRLLSAMARRGFEEEAAIDAIDQLVPPARGPE